MAGERSPQISSTSPSLRKLLEEMQRQGEFRVSVLTSSDGLPIVTVPAHYESDLASAMVALLQRVSNEVQGQIGMAEVDEVIIRDQEATRLVCRRFVVDGNELILVAIVPAGRSYRRVMNQIIRRVKKVLLTF